MALGFLLCVMTISSAHWRDECKFHLFERFSWDKSVTMFSLLICGNSMLYCEKTSICLRYNNKNHPKLCDIWTWDHRHCLQAFFFSGFCCYFWNCLIESRNSKVLCYKDKSFLCRRIFLNRPGSSLSCFLCLAKQVSGKKCCWVGSKFIRIVFTSQRVPLFLMLIGYDNTSRPLIMLNRASLHQSPAFQVCNVVILVTEVIIQI